MAGVEVVGLKDALRELNTFNKSIRRAITKDFRAIVAPAVRTAQQLTPDELPMSGWGRNWDPGANFKSRPYNTRRGVRHTYRQGPYSKNDPGAGGLLPWPQAQAKAIKPFVSGKRPVTNGYYTRNLAVFGFAWNSKQAVLFDMSGSGHTPQGRQMVATLGSRYGAPSRIMWRAYQQSDRLVQEQIQDLVDQIMRLANQRLQYYNSITNGVMRRND